jgi:hypothetical protein
LGSYWDNLAGDVYVVGGSAVSIDRWPVMIDSPFPLTVVVVVIVGFSGIAAILAIFKKRKS